MLVDLSFPLCAVGPCSFSVNNMEFGSKFEHCDHLDGKQEEHFRFDLTHAQFWQIPLLLHRQQVGMFVALSPRFDRKVTKKRILRFCTVRVQDY